MKISFYTLSNDRAQDILGFICGLTQKAVNNSEQTIILLSDNETLMDALDEALWSHEVTSFIPHQRLLNDNNATDSPINGTINNAADTFLAPVLLSPYLPAAFKGIVLNTTTRPITYFITTNNRAAPNRILELIAPDEQSMQAGRDKYKHYKNLGYELNHFKV